MKGKSIFKEEISGYFYPISSTLEIIDRDKDNVVVYVPIGLSEIDGMKTYTIKPEILDSIKTLINDSTFLFDGTELEEPEYPVLDGSQYHFEFNSDNNQAIIDVSNLFIDYNGVSPDTKAAKLISLIKAIESILINASVDLEGVSEEDDEDDW